jgi:hypothetical protein
VVEKSYISTTTTNNAAGGGPDTRYLAPDLNNEIRKQRPPDEEKAAFGGREYGRRGSAARFSFLVDNVLTKSTQ